MSFISNAVKLIRWKKSTSNDQIEEGCGVAESSAENIQVKEQNSLVENSTDFDFSLRDYAKESFSVLIKRPLSACMLKLMRIMTSITAGVLSGTVFAVLVCLIFLQFGSIENTVVSSFISKKFDALFPDAELNIKSANFSWNPESRAFEIDMKKVRINDFLIPHISIQPDYLASMKSQSLVAKSISITNPKISLDMKNGWKHASINPNFGMKSNRKSMFVPLEEIDDFKQIVNPNTKIKFINADIALSHNNEAITLKNVYYEYNTKTQLPEALSVAMTLPGQKYASSFNLNHVRGNKYKLKLVSVNPGVLMDTLSKMNIALDKRLSSTLEGYNLPVSGSVNLKFENGQAFGDFELSGVNGSVRLPANSIFALNLGKKIDHGEVSGSFGPKEAVIDSLRANYGNAGLQLTGIKIPLKNYKFRDKANIDGTLSLTNIDVAEMEAILPERIATSAVSPLKKCLPGFKLEEFRVDLKGPVAFDDNGVSNLRIGQGVFNVKDAKIAVSSRYINHVNASGVVMNDGIDIKIANAEYNKIKINQGILYISSKDGAAIGNLNIDLPIRQLSTYANLISPRIAKLPLDKLGIKGTANLDVKVVSLNEEKGGTSEFPFKVVQGNGFISSDMNSKKLKISWDDKGASLSGDMKLAGSRASIQFNEDYAKNTAHSLLKFLSKSDFQRALVPGIENILDGNYVLTLNSDCKADGMQDCELSINLKDATISTPFTGSMKQKASEGKFTAHVVQHDDVYEFSNMNFSADNNKFSGTMTVDKNGNVIRCSFPEFVVNGASAKIQVLNKDKNQLFLSAIGNNLNIKQLQTFLNSQKHDMLASIYVNLQEVKYGTDKLRNVQGTIDVKNGKIIGGSCYGVLGNDTTIALSAKNVKDKSITTISASNAGDVLRHLNISDAVQGGNLNIVLNANEGLGKSQSGVFEITNCIVKDSELLGKMVSLSSVNLLPTNNLTVGFNRCTGKFIFTEKALILDKFVALSPSFAISFSGKYDRLSDNWDVSGMCLPMSSYYSSNNEEILMAPFKLNGSMGSPSIFVNPMEYIERGVIFELFGNLLPTSRAGSNYIAPSGAYDDPYSQGAFDKAIEAPTGQAAPREKNENSNKAGVKAQRKNGVTIVRGKADN